MFLSSRKLLNTSAIRHGFFTRNGGVSTGIFAELNCGGRNIAEPAQIVDENRERVATALSLQADHLLSVHQVHGPAVAIVATTWQYDARPKADAMVCATPGFGLGILTADCAPVLFVDPVAGVIGAAHSGWKGASGGVLQATISAMEKIGAKRDAIIAAVGPCIAQPSYEVDGTFYERFIAMDPRNADFFTNFSDDGHCFFDLPGFVARVLVMSGIRDIDVLGNDTYADEKQFYSFRRSTHRNEPDYGRQLSVITLGTTRAQ